MRLCVSISLRACVRVFVSVWLSVYFPLFGWLWIPPLCLQVFEKAWAKLHGSYEATAAGQTGDALNYLTGGLVSHIEIVDDNEHGTVRYSALSLIPDVLITKR